MNQTRRINFLSAKTGALEAQKLTKFFSSIVWTIFKSKLANYSKLLWYQKLWHRSHKRSSSQKKARYRMRKGKDSTFFGLKHHNLHWWVLLVARALSWAHPTRSWTVYAACLGWHPGLHRKNNRSIRCWDRYTKGASDWRLCAYPMHQKPAWKVFRNRTYCTLGPWPDCSPRCHTNCPHSSRT